ncbi:MAG: hypothetical protein EXR62_10645 [Chloroflexi bacterium]|nr:hypothetical protein [Chloroflexota bacterium]
MTTDNQNIRAIGSRLELLCDTWLIDTLSDDASLQLHHPERREVALVTDRPWEGNMCGYMTIFQDGERARLYYCTGRFDPDTGTFQPSNTWIAYAESRDGRHWERPELELHEVEGYRRNNILFVGEGPQQNGTHGFAPFKDTHPGVDPAARYKAVGAGNNSRTSGLFALVSPDGIHWSLLQPEPVMRGAAYDSQNLAFWDAQRQEYRAYVRDFRNGVRGILTCTSQDFVHWTDPVWLDYPGVPEEPLYTNQVLPYYRAPHLLIGFPSRYVERPWSPSIEALPEPEHRRLRGSVHPRYGSAVTDGLFMSSRDGQTFRRWPEAFIRPGPQLEGNWTYGDNYQCWGLLETPSDLAGAPPELSFLAVEHYWRGGATLFRRYALRIDGFVSVQAPLSGGEILTQPLTFDGRQLHLNFSTSAAGGLWVEVQDAAGQPIAGFTQADCYEVIGDELERVVTWRGGSDLGALAGQPVRLRVTLKDADLYALRFK